MKCYILLFFFILSQSSLFGQVEKVEPPFWWSGMEKSNLELMLYGKEIAKYDVRIPSVQILKITKTENQNYIFVDIDIARIQSGYFSIFIEDGDKSIQTINYQIHQRKQNSAQREGFNSSDLVYLIMPDRFANGDTNNDNITGMLEDMNRSDPGGRHGGDIAGIRSKLDYLEDLGVTALWSTPLCEDDYHKYSYHHYAQSDVYKIDPRFGTNEDYKYLAKDLHKRDMKLIMDYVTNHWSINHWMIKDLPSYNWIHQFPGFANSNYRMTTQYDPNTSKRDKKYCEDGWFVPTMPDLNQRNHLVLNYLIQNAIWWIEYADLDGLRVDTYSYNDKDAIAEWTKAIMDEYPNFNIVGEAWLHNQAQISYWQKNSPISAIQSYNTHCPSVMDFTLHDAIMTIFSETEESWDKGLIKVYDNLSNDFLYADINNLMLFAENHDTPRFNESYEDIRDYKLVMTLLATMRGIPQIYYGSEVGMKGKKDFGDGDIRRDFEGGWPDDKENKFKESGRTERQKEYHSFTKKVFNWRKNKSVIHTGKTMQFIPEKNVYVYFRYNENEQVMVILNNSLNDQSLDLSRFAERIGQNKIASDIITEKEYSLIGTLPIKAKSSIILEIE